MMYKYTYTHAHAHTYSLTIIAAPPVMTVPDYAIPNVVAVEINGFTPSTVTITTNYYIHKLIHHLPCMVFKLSPFPPVHSRESEALQRSHSRCCQCLL